MREDTKNFKTVKRPRRLPQERLDHIDYTDEIERVDSVIEYLIQTGDIVKYKKKLLLSSAFGCCDTETTTLPAGSAYNPGEVPLSFIYLVQFRLGEINWLFRDVQDFRIFIDRIARILRGQNMILVVYVHNLSFEWQFLKSVLDVDLDGVFALQNRRIGKFSTNDHQIEWRCSYLLSNMSLEKFAENYADPSRRKDKDLIDYEILRFPWSPLEDETLYYSLMDVVSLDAAIQTLMTKEGDSLRSIPMTNTGYVRRSYKDACIGQQTKHYRTDEEKKEYRKFRNYRRLFLKTQLNYEQYRLCCDAFRGGNTHANRFIVGQILPAGPEDGDKIGHVDFASSYPAQLICSREYPTGRLMDCTQSLQDARKISWYAKRYWLIVEAAFEDIHLRDPYATKCPYIPLAKVKREHAKSGIYDNGRIIEQPGVMIYAFLGVEWEVIRQQYAGSIRVIRAYYAPKSFLPDEFRRNCFYWYEQKTTLKGVKGKEYEYMKSKNRVNSSFGMCVEHIVKDINELQEDLTFKTRRPTQEEAEKQLEDFYTPMKQKFLSFQWGITVTALARVEHMKLIDIVGDDFVYGDTDSVFFLHPEKYEEDIRKYNKIWTSYAASCGCGYRAYTAEGDLQILGVADREPDADRFVTLGAKKYAMEINGKLDITVAGVPKKQGAKLLGKLENFKPGYLFYIDDRGSLEERQDWKKILHYHDNKPFTVRIEDHDLRIGTGIGITRAPYKLDITEEYKLLTGYTEIYTEDDVWE